MSDCSKGDIEMKLLVVEDDHALNQGIALSFGSETVVQAFLPKSRNK